MKGVILLSDAVKQILLSTKRPESEYFRFLSLAAEGVTKLRLHVVSYPKQVELTLPDSGVVDWPEDALRIISVGVAHFGKLWTYTLRNDMITVLDEDGNPQETINDPTPANRMAVRGGKNSHYFKIDHEERRVYVMGYPPQDIYVTYESSGISTTTATYIPLEIVPALKAFIMWEEQKYDPNIYPSHKQLAEGYFHQERNLLKSLRQPSVEEWGDAIMRTYTRRFRR